MALIDMFRKSDPVEDAFAEMEDEVSALVELDMQAPSVDPIDDVEAAAAMLAEATQEFQANAPQETARLTAHTQSALAALSSFETVHRGARADLDRLGELLSNVSAAQHAVGTFIGTVHSGMLRANEIERANASLTAENRRLAQAADRVKRLSAQLESLTEGFRRKELRLTEEGESLRETVNLLQTELAEMREERGAMESERADLLNQLAGKSTSIERMSREAEMMRERQLNLSVELENSQRRHTDLERKYNELHAVHVAEHAQIFELRSRMAEAEKDLYRVQKALDASQARLTETQDGAASREAELSRRDAERSAENQKLKSEAESLRARIDIAARGQQNADTEIAELKQKVADLSSANALAGEKISTLQSDLASERKLAASMRGAPSDGDGSSTGEAELAADQAAEIDRLRGENEKMRITLERIARSRQKAREAQDAKDHPADAD